MKSIYLVAVVIRPLVLVEEPHISMTFACESAPDLDAMIARANELGFAASIDVEKIEPLEGAGLSHFFVWVADHATVDENVDPKPVAIPDPVDARFNELERSVRNNDRKMDQLLALVERIAPPLPKAPACTIHGTDLRMACAECRLLGEHVKPAPPVEWTPNGDNRRSRSGRGATPEFSGSSSLQLPESTGVAGVRDGSMGLLGVSASPSRNGVGATKILIGSLDSKGEPIVIEEKPTTVGDTLRRGT